MTPPATSDAAANRLLSKLSDEDRARLTPHMMAFDFKVGHVLQEVGHDVVDTWFPCGSALASFCVGHRTGATVEVALVGSEGAIGGIVSNGRLPSYSQAQVRSAGRFLRIKTSALEMAKLDSISLRHWFSRYSDCLLAQVFQTAACNATHTITQRAARWLLAAQARITSAEFKLTQEELANLLGVGRTFVTRIVGRLREEGVIATRRGVFVVRNERALRTLSCNCTTAIEDHFDTVLHGVYPL
jgi:biotin operon repressor